MSVAGQINAGSVPLDFEKEESVSFSIRAFDSGIPQMNTSLRVVANVVNTNDEPPVFTKVNNLDSFFVLISANQN